jgi:hypothetical protein
MKKLLFALFVLAISSQVFAEITVKQVLGDWKYIVNTDQGALTGVIRLTEKEGKLAGSVISDDGNTFAVSKLEIKEGDILYFEIVPEYDVIKVSLKIDGKKFTGTVGTDQGEIPITGEKKE